jgi:carbon monoxide dehydrogenase subunit G
MQMGGIVRGLTHAMLGERGPEAVIPLGGGRRAMGLLDYATRALTGGRGGMGGTHVNFTPNITIHGNADEVAQRAMDSRLRDLVRDFIGQFKAAQYQERRLSYESGY